MFNAIFQVSAALIKGRVLQARNVSVGNGLVIDWRTVKSGETIGKDLDPYDAAVLFVELIGPSTAFEAATQEKE